MCLEEKMEMREKWKEEGEKQEMVKVGRRNK